MPGVALMTQTWNCLILYQGSWLQTAETNWITSAGKDMMGHQAQKTGDENMFCQGHSTTQQFN